MNATILHTYFPNIVHFVAMLQASSIYFEICDNYQKQSLRNRTEIFTSNGKLALTVPINYTQKKRQLYRDVQIDYNTDWQSLHFKSLQSAYKSSPFFEFYIDDLLPLFTKKHRYLLDFNKHCLMILVGCLQINLSSKNTVRFEKKTFESIDFRTLAKKNNKTQFSPYTQVFCHKLGFISNLSILDLLFNEGPCAELYLKKQKIY